MARARNIKPGFFESDQLGEVSFCARLLFIAMWQLADRCGRLERRPAKLRAYAFRYDALSVADVDKMLAELERASLIVLTDADGLDIIEIPTFAKHQTPHPKEPSLYEPRKVSALPPGEAQKPRKVSAHPPSHKEKPRKVSAFVDETGVEPPLNPESLLLNADGAVVMNAAPPARTQQQQRLADFGSEPDPSQLVAEAVEAVAKHWPLPGSIVYAKRAWEVEASTDLGGVANWCKNIQQTALVHSVAHTECRKANPRHFVPTLERWVSHGDYRHKPPEAPPKQRGMTRVIDMFPEGVANGGE
jgi:hypothetical protein